jgi:hypothetical protein
MKPIVKIFLVLTTWVFFGGLVALSIIFDGVYIQLCFDFALVFITALTTYYLKGNNAKA